MLMSTRNLRIFNYNIKERGWVERFLFYTWSSRKLTLSKLKIINIPNPKAITKNAKKKCIVNSQIDKLEWTYENIQIHMKVERKNRETKSRWLIIKLKHEFSLISDTNRLNSPERKHLHENQNQKQNPENLKAHRLSDEFLQFILLLKSGRWGNSSGLILRGQLSLMIAHTL